MKSFMRALALIALAAVQLLSVQPVQARALAAQSQLMPAALQAAITSETARPFSEVDGAYMAGTGGLTVQLDTHGLNVGAAGLQWGLDFNGMGRGNHVDSIASAKAKQNGSKLEFDHGSVIEWYYNSTLGIEQGFTVPATPQGNGQLVLRLGLSTDLHGALARDGRSLHFDTGNGTLLQYGNLRVTDARGQDLNARLIYTPAQILIQVDDTGAVYPLTVDPIIYFENKALALDTSPGDQFGIQVVISGNTAVVGEYNSSPSTPGTAYIFQRSGMVWSEQAELTPSDGVVGDAFGSSVAISGDSVVVGALLRSSGQGAAYVFVEPPRGWSDMTETAKLTASDGVAGDRFGAGVAISGDTIAVGAPVHQVGGHAGQGQAYVFVRPAGGWTSGTETAILTSSDGAVGDRFGAGGVAMTDDTIVVGAPLSNVGANADQGAVYVFTKSSLGWLTSAETAKLTASDGSANDQLGFFLGISGDAIVAGTGNPNSGQGSAYVFVEPRSGWASGSETAELTASDGQPGDNFGNGVAISGDTIVVGAANAQINANAAQGAAYLYIRPGSGWGTTSTFYTKLVSSDGAANDNFGYSVAISADAIMAGAPCTNTCQGSIYSYFPYRTDQDLSVGALASSSSPVPGQTVTFTASVLDLGPATATNVLLSAPLPAGFTYAASAATYGGSYNPSTGAWQISSLPVGIVATLTIQATVEGRAAGSSAAFTASLLSSDTNPANNVGTVTVHVPLLSFNPGSLAFGDQQINTASALKTVTVTNVSDESVTLGILKSSSTAFVISGSTCAKNLILDTYATCSFKVQFKPTATLAYSGGISLPSTIPTDSATLTLAGYGARPAQLLSDRSFEIDANHDNLPDGWTKNGTTWTPSEGRECIFAPVGACAVVFHGDGSTKQLAFNANHAGTAGDILAFGVLRRAYQVPVGATFRATIQLYNGSTPVGTWTVNFPGGSTGFAASTLSITTPGTYTREFLIFEYTAPSGTVYFDNASLVWKP
jgi:uncharacterized repeat protein (TIGR01451 family)